MLVCNADILTDIDYIALLSSHEGQRADMTVVTVPHEVSVPFGVISVDDAGEILSVVEKPSFSYRVSAGTYVINPELLTLITAGERVDMPQLMDRAKKAGYLVCAYEYDGFWMDVGRPGDLQRASEELKPVERTA